MHFSKKVLPRLLMIAFVAGTAMHSYAQDATPATSNASVQPNNQFLILLALVIIILAFVIWGMGQVLVTLGQQLNNKNKAANKATAGLLIAGLSLLSFTGKAQNKIADATDVAPNYGGLSSTAFWTIAGLLMLEVFVIFFMLILINRLKDELLPQAHKQRSFRLGELWTKLDKKLFTKAVSVEREADILLDHDYDGIRELDNSLPPWWKYGFVITIGIAIVYLLNFHVLGYGKNPTEEYQQEIANAQEAKEIYEAKNKDRVDEKNIKMPSAAELASAKEIFNSVCWACHGKQGEGGAGPNLTDDYWLHKGSLTDIYFSIKHGYPEKGMQAWEKNYSLKEISNLAGFVKTLHGSNPPNSKAPQGELFKENNTRDSLAILPGKEMSLLNQASSSLNHN